jgi:hypothetical protein
MCKEAMFNWKQSPKRIAEMEANPLLPNGNEIGTPLPSVRITTKFLQ